MAKSINKEFKWSSADISNIFPDERDCKLSLEKDDWYEALTNENKNGWHLDETNERCPKSPQRILVKKDTNEKLKEIIIRFPSAPIYGIHREFNYQLHIDRINYHTFRVIKHENQSEPIKHVYVMLNGLNETDAMSFFYDAALQIINKNEKAACIIRPFPGHLTRFPLPGLYAEQPLDRYLADSGDLYRQYLRFMIETRWLLSCIVPIRNYPIIVGYDFNVEGKLDEESTGRADPNELAADILNEWRRLFDASRENNSYQQDPSEKRDPGEEIKEDVAILESIQLVRKTINWHETKGNLTSPPDSDKIMPQIHVFGYSLGGFLAQCLFFSWPYAISTCTTICSGGWLRDLAPTKFSHPEEWQQVLYGLRFEIEDSMLNNRINRTQENKLVSGISEDAFSFYTRIFYEVFIQEIPEKYLSRVSELGHRILFIVGGADPIVKTKSLLDASPQGGINMIEIADLGHFLTREVKDRESRWTKFWFPSIMNLIVEFSESAGEVYLESLVKDWAFIQNRNAGKESSDDEETVVIENEILKSNGFRRALTKMVNYFETQKLSWLFIARNKPPTVLFGDDAVYESISTLHYRDSLWIKYLKSVNNRCNILKSKQNRLFIIMPKDVKKYFLKSKALLPPRHNMHSSVEHAEIWRRFEKNWNFSKKPDSFRDNPFWFFNPSTEHAIPEKYKLFLDLVKKKLHTEYDEVVNILPDIWLYLGKNAVDEIRNQDLTEERPSMRDGLIAFATNLISERSPDPKMCPRTNTDNKLKEFIQEKEIQIVKVSGAEFNPQYRGQLILNSAIASKLIIHCALSLCYSSIEADSTKVV